MADKILVLRVGNKSLRLAERAHHLDVDDEVTWSLLVKPQLLAEFIDEEAGEGRSNVSIEEVDDTSAEVDELRVEMKRMRDHFDYAMSNVRTLTETVTRMERLLEFKHLEAQYPKREQIATKQDDERLLRDAEAGAQPVIPPQTKPMPRYGEPRVHDLTGRFPKINYERPKTKVEEIVEESKGKVDYEAAKAKAASQPERTLEEVEAEAERVVDETEKPRGFCGICGETTSTCICASCAALMCTFGEEPPNPGEPITYGRARHIREWLEKCEQIADRAGTPIDAPDRIRLNKIIGINEAERKLKMQLGSVRVPGDANIRAYVNKEQLKNPLHEEPEPYVAPEGNIERDDTGGMPF